MKLTIIRQLGFIITWFFAFTLQAAETGYEVELIIFEDTTARYLSSEDWSYNDMLNNKQKEPSQPVKKDPEYRQLNWDGAKLSSNLERLKKNSNYRVLLNRRWKQTGLDRAHAFEIPLTTENTSPDSESDEPTQNTSSIEQPEANLKNESYITGTVKLIMSRYLHFNVDMQYIKPKYDENGKLQNISFPVFNERRMRSREIHYIDHPLVGVVVLATPYKIKSQDDDTHPGEYKTM